MPRKSKLLKDGTLAESTFQSRIIAALKKIPGVMVYRQQAFTGYTSDGRFFSTGVPEGAADLLVIIRNDEKQQAEYLQVELKSKDGKVRPEQIAFKESIEGLFGRYLVVRVESQNPVSAALKQIFEAAGVEYDTSPRKSKKKSKGSALF